MFIPLRLENMPLRHENMEGRRWPVISIALVLINLVAFLATADRGAPSSLRPTGLTTRGTGRFLEIFYRLWVGTSPPEFPERTPPEFPEPAARSADRRGGQAHDASDKKRQRLRRGSCQNDAGSTQQFPPSLEP